MSTELLVSRIDGRLWAALREDGRTTELRVDSREDRPRAGRILRARVDKILPGMQAAFVDLGGERDAFLHVSGLPPWDPPEQAPPIQSRLREGQALTVQIEREERRRKGARVTCRLSISGRLLVLMPGESGGAVSRRIVGRDERRRLVGLLDRLPRADSGWIARTAASGCTFETLRAEAETLLERWRLATSAAASATRLPAIVLHEPDLLEELLRELPEEGVDRIVLDRPEDRQAVIDRLSATDPRLAARVHLHSDREVPLFVATGVATEIDRALLARVWLRSGGYVVIEETEALVSIDVNTGKNTGKLDLERTVLKTNLEAADEIPRQLRLRGLGGIVVVDMIDMKDEANRTAVMERFREALRPDPARARVAGVDPFGLIVLTRKSSRPSLAELTTDTCPTCRGRGRVRQAQRSGQS